MERDFRYLRDLHGDAGAREIFEEICAQLLYCIHGSEAHHIKVAKGDQGVDIIVGDTQRSVIVYQCKFFLDGIHNSQKNQIQQSFNRLINNKELVVSKWVLCIPCSMSNQEYFWWNEWKNEKQKDNDIKIELYDKSNLISELKRHNLYNLTFDNETQIKLDKIIEQLRNYGQKLNNQSQSFLEATEKESQQQINSRNGVHVVDIFICYRRSGAAPYARGMYDHLLERGYSVYYDIECERRGNFAENLREAIDSCKDFIVLLSPDSFKRVHEPEDVFFQEIAHAKEKDKNIIGVMLPGFNMFPKDIPHNISFLPKIQCLSLTMEYYNAFLDKLTSSQYLLSVPRSSARKNDQISWVEFEENDLFRDPRFLRQSDLYYQVDMQAICEVINNFQRKGLTVLDLGSGDCEVSCSRFGGIAAVSKVICIDSDSRQVEEGRARVARDAHYAKFTVIQLNLEEEDFVFKLRKVLRKNNIQRVDIVFSAMTFHHLQAPESVLSHIRTIMADDGYFILRELDDDTKVYYAQGDSKAAWMKKVVEAYQRVFRYTDRNCARKMFSWLTLQGFSEIKLFYDQIDTCGKSKQEREDIFNIMVGFRKARAEKRLLNYAFDEESKCSLEEVIKASDELKDLFLDEDFWFFVTNYVAVARKYSKKRTTSVNKVPIELYLIRHAHCDIEDTEDGLKMTISDEGKKEIAALSRALVGVEFDAVICSNMQRAIETAAPIAESHHLSLEQYAELNEIDRGDIASDSLWAENEYYYRRWKKHETDLPFPNGENGIDVWLRGKYVIDRIRENAANLNIQDRPYRVCIVTHGGTIRALICGLLGIPERMRYQFARELHPCSTTIIRIGADSSDNVNTDHTATLELFNDDSYLRNNDEFDGN